MVEWYSANGKLNKATDMIKAIPARNCSDECVRLRREAGGIKTTILFAGYFIYSGMASQLDAFVSVRDYYFLLALVLSASLFLFLTILRVRHRIQKHQ